MSTPEAERLGNVHLIVRTPKTRALQLGERLRTGALHINDQTVADDVINPFGGAGAALAYPM